MVLSLQFSPAEALFFGQPGKSAYAPESLQNPQILALARKVHYHVDPGYRDPGRFKGAVRIVLNDGPGFEEVEEYNRGSAENPMIYAELRAKFDENASGMLFESETSQLADEINRLEQLADPSKLLDLAVNPS